MFEIFTYEKMNASFRITGKIFPDEYFANLLNNILELKGPMILDPVADFAFLAGILRTETPLYI